MAYGDRHIPGPKGASLCGEAGPINGFFATSPLCPRCQQRGKAKRAAAGGNNQTRGDAFAPKTVKIISVLNGRGLTRDVEILTAAFEHAGWTVLLSDASAAVSPSALNVHVERVAPERFRTARRNIILPNPEWWRAEWTPLLTEKNVTVWAKTQHAARIFEALGADVTYIGFQSTDHALPDRIRERAFLHIGDAQTNTANKRTALLLDVWQEDWLPLTIVSAGGPRRGRHSNIHIITERLTVEEIRALQNRHAFHIYPSRYEGFGHALWEGLSTGAVVFAPDAAPFNECRGFRPLRVFSGRVSEGVIDYCEVTPRGIQAAVEWACAQTEEALEEAARHARGVWEENQSRFALRIGQTIDGVLRPKKITTLHSAQEICGVREYGRMLDAGFRACGIHPATLDYISAQKAPALSCDTDLLIHYEPGLETASFQDDVRRLRANGARVIFCAHYFDESIHRRWTGAVDGIAVHRDYPGLVDGRFVRVIPHGCPSRAKTTDRGGLRVRLGLPVTARILTVFGFLFPWKRHPELVAQIARRAPADVFLQVLTARHFTGDANEEAQIARALRGVSPDRYFFSTAFLPEDNVQDRLAASDLGLVYHGVNTGSVSGVTKQFVAAGCPFIVTASTHAADITRGCVRVASLGITEFVETAITVLNDGARLAQLRCEIDHERSRLDITNIAEQYLRFFAGI